MLMKRIALLILTLITVNCLAEARQPHRGYRGFLEWSNQISREQIWSGYGSPESYWSTGVSTSHGYQINPVVFVGAGLSVERCGKLDRWLVPVFAEGRADLQFGRFTPFADLKAGANFGEGIGIYLSPTVGYRFNWGRKMGVNIGLGYTLAGYKIDCYEGDFYGPALDGGYLINYVGTVHRTRSYFTFRIGIDF